MKIIRDAHLVSILTRRLKNVSWGVVRMPAVVQKSRKVAGFSEGKTNGRPAITVMMDRTVTETVEPTSMQAFSTVWSSRCRLNVCRLNWVLRLRTVVGRLFYPGRLRVGVTATSVH